MPQLLEQKHLGTMKQLIDLSASNYPEMLSEMIVVNAPAAFRSVWPVIARFLDAKTLKKVQVTPE